VKLFRQDDGHPGVDLPYKFWFTNDDRAGVQPFAVRWIFPSLPQPCKHEGESSFMLIEVRNLAAGNFFPFEEAIRQYEAAPFPERLSVRRCRIDRFGPRIDSLARDLWIFGPVRNQAPSQSVQGAVLGFWVESDREHILSRRKIAII